MTEVRQVAAGEWAVVRDVRLRALEESPDWFWATYDEQVDKPEEWWRAFVAKGAWFIARDGERSVGIAAALPGSDMRPDVCELISLWVDPSARRGSVGTGLIRAVIEWARSSGIDRLQLEVTEKNDAARRLYERSGFEASGRTRTLPRNPQLVEHEMVLDL